MQISAELKQWLLTTIRHYSPLFALFVLFAIRYSPLFAVRYSRLFAVRCSLFATIRYSGFPDTRRAVVAALSLQYINYPPRFSFKQTLLAIEIKLEYNADVLYQIRNLYLNTRWDLNKNLGLIQTNSTCVRRLPDTNCFTYCLYIIEITCINQPVFFVSVFFTQCKLSKVSQHKFWA